MKRAAPILTILLLLAAPAARAGVRVILKDMARVGATYVRLAAVADLEGDPAAAARVGKLFLGKAPAAGETLSYSRDYIEKRLRDMGLGQGVRLDGATVVHVRYDADMAFRHAERERLHAALARPIREEEKPSAPAPDESGPTDAQLNLIAAAVRTHLERMFAPRTVEVTVDVRKVYGTLSDATTAVRIEDVNGGDLPGRAQVRLGCFNPAGRRLGEVRARVEARATGRVLVLRRPVRRDGIVTADNLMTARQALTNDGALLAPEPAVAAGRAATRALRAMTALTESDLEAPDVVGKGAVVLIDTRAGGFRIKTYGRALSNAKRGGLLMVQNLRDPNKRFLARAVGKDRVELATADRSVR